MEKYLLTICHILVSKQVQGQFQPGHLRFPNLSDVTTKLNKHARDQFASGHPLLDSRVTDQVASEAVFCTKTGVQTSISWEKE